MRALTPTTRRVFVVVHAIAGVAVIGDVWGLALMHWEALTSGSLALSRAAFRFTSVMVFGGGVPFSLVSLTTGLVLALFGKWSLRQVWILVKLGLQLSILATGALFIGPILMNAPHQPDPGQSEQRFLVLLAAQGVSLVVATALAVFKPGSRHRRSRRAHVAGSDETGEVGGGLVGNPTG